MLTQWRFCFASVMLAVLVGGCRTQTRTEKTLEALKNNFPGHPAITVLENLPGGVINEPVIVVARIGRNASGYVMFAEWVADSPSELTHIWCYSQDNRVLNVLEIEADWLDAARGEYEAGGAVFSAAFRGHRVEQLLSGEPALHSFAVGTATASFGTPKPVSLFGMDKLKLKGSGTLSE